MYVGISLSIDLVLYSGMIQTSDTSIPTCTYDSTSVLHVRTTMSTSSSHSSSHSYSYSHSSSQVILIDIHPRSYFIILSLVCLLAWPTLALLFDPLCQLSPSRNGRNEEMKK